MEEISALLTEIYSQIAVGPIAMAAFRVLLILLGAYVASKLANRVIRGLRIRFVNAMKKREGVTSHELEKRAQTVGGVIRKALTAVILTLGVIMSMREVGFDIGPILAGAGVVGLAVGFGAQNLVRDLMTGLFMLIENQIRVNDVAIINGTGGLVEEINLRTTVLRGLDGTIHVFPNGAINSLSNMTHQFSYYVFEIGVAYKEDTDHVVEVLKDVADGLMQDEPYRSAILAPLEVLGVDQFADSAVIIKTRIKTIPIKQWMVGREMNRRIKKKFDEVGIEIPFPHQSIYFGEASKPFKLEREVDRDALKGAVREALREMQSGGTKETDRGARPTT